MLRRQPPQKFREARSSPSNNFAQTNYEDSFGTGHTRTTAISTCTDWYWEEVLGSVLFLIDRKFLSIVRNDKFLCFWSAAGEILVFLRRQQQFPFILNKYRCFVECFNPSFLPQKVGNFSEKVGNSRLISRKNTDLDLSWEATCSKLQITILRWCTSTRVVSTPYLEWVSWRPDFL